MLQQIAVKFDTSAYVTKQSNIGGSREGGLGEPRPPPKPYGPNIIWLHFLMVDLS